MPPTKAYRLLWHMKCNLNRNAHYRSQTVGINGITVGINGITAGHFGIMWSLIYQFNLHNVTNKMEFRFLWYNKEWRRYGLFSTSGRLLMEKNEDLLSFEASSWSVGFIGGLNKWYHFNQDFMVSKMVLVKSYWHKQLLCYGSLYRGVRSASLLQFMRLKVLKLYLSPLTIRHPFYIGQSIL